ncbi:MAG: TonB family protein [Myxococcus sp.]|nr:TonB family protein [Myxococcus sp.]
MTSAVMSSPPPRPSSNDDLVSWVILGVMLTLSIVTHLVTAVLLPDQAAARRKNQRVEMEFYEPPPPPPPKVEEPEPPKPVEPPKEKVKPPPVKVAEVKPPPIDAPPPPNEEPPPNASDKPVPLVVGISMSSTAAGGTFAVGVGNTTYGKADTTPTDPSQVKAYRAPKYVPPGGADTQPDLIGDYKPPYPEEARRNEIEGTVVLRVTIDEEGTVTEVKVLRGLGFGLDEASVVAMKKHRFKPATKDGEKVGTTITFNFSWYLE